MQQDLAQILAIRALGWMAGEEAVWLAFLGASGADAAQVRAEAAQPAMQRAVLAHLLREDDWVRSCAEALAVRPEELALAAAVLDGAAGRNWT
ncbi:uncharacterized protein DUF3572 [Rhodobacter capsulatus]|uniref:DUF3572 family protein n=1 Tax=Rhodobacter capsulatus TaxID=1061 RepID=A0A0Q0QNU0_RHOCA|nr:hypothetical protein AP073_10695 [Rhodobacter capsulatus]KQB16992.1 hypothetical protein AP071_10520 [Rhodobacter capsulatus]PZX21910.1 uncharacterized protein DUF3572 [Rhodobacter capsulatus]SDF57513.1 Protein of unknown function [Rhodobacter capsulatus]